MAYVGASDLEYLRPDGRMLFQNVSFRASDGERVAIVGANGAGKSTLLRILAGEVEPAGGTVTIQGDSRFMPQDVGFEQAGLTVRDMLLKAAPDPLGEVGRSLRTLEAESAAGNVDAGMAFATKLGVWSDLGGHQLEAEWDKAIRQSMGVGLTAVQDRAAPTLSGGERKQLVLRVLFASAAEILLLDEPDNFLDIPAKRWLEELMTTTRGKTIVLVSHDRRLLTTVPTKLVTVEGTGAWIHPGGYGDYEAARAKRQEALGDSLRRWQEEERRLYRHYRVMKQRAAVNYKNAPKANAAETRWRRFADAGPPPPPVPRRTIRTRLAGADSARRVLRCAAVEIDGLVEPFDLEVMFGERLALVGPNGSGKTHLLRALAQKEAPDGGTVELGNRVTAGHFTQTGEPPGLAGETVLDAASDRLGDSGRALAALARYGLHGVAAQAFSTLSGGEKARFEILLLELEGCNLLLLDEPTDNLDIDSASALQEALEESIGAVVAVSHDRWFLERFDRFVYLDLDGLTYEIDDARIAMTVLTGEVEPRGARHVKPLARAG